MKDLKIILPIILFGLLFINGCGGGSSSTKIDSENNSEEQTNNSKADDLMKRDPTAKEALFSDWELSSSKKPVYTLTTDGIVSDFSSIVYDKHPRLYFRDSDKSYLDGRKDLSEWKVLESTIVSRITKDDSFESISEKLNGIYADTEYPQLLTFYAYMSGDQYYKDVAIRWAVDVLSKEEIIDNSSQDRVIRARIARLAEVYDWLYADLSQDQKRTIRDALKKNIDMYMSWDYVVNPDFIQSHSRWGHGVVEQGLLAMYGDFDENHTKAYADTMLSKIRELLREYEDVERYIAYDGGWHLGWMYAYFYADYTFNYQVWSSATKETMLDDWMGELSYWFIYAKKRDGRLPVMGDTTMNDLHLGYYATLYQSKYKRDGYAKWYLDEIAKSDFQYNNYMIKFLLSDSSVEAKSPTALPFSRYFKHSGTVICRDGWDDNETLLIFKSSTFYNAGHHHRDENSFTIDYKSPLAVDSGFYDMADTPHYKNYYVRTIAHNAITVYNPNQKMYYNVHYNENEPLSNKLLPNDGGQIYFPKDSVTKEDITGPYRLDGVTKYHYENDYTYMQGDATKAYDPMTVTLEKRDILYIKNSGYDHPIIIVLDKIEAKDPSFQKRYLLHMDSSIKPTISANSTEVITDNSKMINITLYPKDASLKVVGAVDKGSKDAYPYYGVDVDTTPDMSKDTVKTILANTAKTGNWRLEVAPKIGKKYDLILNAIFVGDMDMATPTDVELVDSENSMGVLLKDRVIIFSKDIDDTKKSLEYKVPKSGSFKYTIISGYTEGESVNISVNGTIKTKEIVKSGGCIDFVLEVDSGSLINISK